MDCVIYSLYRTQIIIKSLHIVHCQEPMISAHLAACVETTFDVVFFVEFCCRITPLGPKLVGKWCRGGLFFLTCVEGNINQSVLFLRCASASR